MRDFLNLKPDPIDVEDEQDIFNDDEATKPKPKQRQSRMGQFYLDDCLTLKVGHFGRGLLRRAEAEPPELEKTAFIQLGALTQIKVLYRVGKDLTPYIDIHCQFKGLWITQRITLDYSIAGFGLRPFFSCPSCGHVSAKLYLHPERRWRFACRLCMHLNYELNGIHKETKYGKATYFGLTMNKLLDQGDSFKRKVYANHITKRFQAYARRYSRWQEFFGEVS